MTSEPSEQTDDALKKSKTNRSQSAHKTPKKSSPTNRKTPARENSQSPTPGARYKGNLVDSESDRESETRQQSAVHFPFPPSNPNIDEDQFMITAGQQQEPYPPPGTPPPLPTVRAPSLVEEMARTVPARRAENPHLANCDAVSFQDPGEVMFYNNLEKHFVKNSGQFPRVVLDLSFLLEGQDDHVAESVRNNPNNWLAVVPALGGHHLFTQVPEVVDLFASSLAEATGCEEMLVLRSAKPQTSNPNRGRGRRGRVRGRGGRGTSDTSHTPKPAHRDHFSPPFAAFLEVSEEMLRERLVRQQTFSKSKIITCHVVPVPSSGSTRNWTVGQFWTMVKKYDNQARATILYAIKSKLFDDRTFRSMVRAMSSAAGGLDDKVLMFLDTFDLQRQDYEYTEGRMSQYRWVLYAAPISMDENLLVREDQENGIRAYIRNQQYAHGMFAVQGTSMMCSLCKAKNHNRFACPFTASKDWQGPDATESVKDIRYGVQGESEAGQEGLMVVSVYCYVSASYFCFKC
ncbi:hypothetical protein BT96DRAFT_1025747 [Gymnopus androsaceus JB14]|uniref:Uncharacterized protein n=1 Tax=Gymnopus androsaceus JB14 TaxID=1447944 RepID=A0A6A4GQR6_9AGAR|nr:hypothetical protein BT96DRAFT_1025747 [Gymnopus androsaceus JB14]